MIYVDMIPSHLQQRSLLFLSLEGRRMPFVLRSFSKECEREQELVKKPALIRTKPKAKKRVTTNRTKASKNPAT